MEPTTICTAACDGCRYWDQCALLRDGVVRQCHRESQKSQRNRVGGKKSEIKKVEESGEGGDGEKGKGRKTTPKPMMAASNANNYNVDDRQGRVAEEILLSAKLETQLLGDCNILNTDSAPHRRRSGDLGCHHSARAGEKFVHTSTTVTNFIMSRAKYRRRLAVDFHCRLFGMKCWILSPEASFLEIRSQRTIWYLISFLMEQN